MPFELFWLVIVLGLILSVSGFALLFQNLVPGRDLMQLAIFVHAVSAILLVCIVFGHIYMAVSMKGTLEAMKSGNVDANWAKDHHRHWYEEMEQSGKVTEKSAILQGIEDHRGWTIGIDRMDGTLSMSSTGPEVQFMIMGKCAE